MYATSAVIDGFPEGEARACAQNVKAHIGVVRKRLKRRNPENEDRARTQ